jgi:hypothetical protein
MERANFMKRKLISLVAAIGLLALCTAAVQAAGGTSTLTVAAGSLSIAGAAPGNFTATLAGSDQQVYTTLAAYSATDSTGKGLGWHVTFQATQFACTNPTDVGCPVGGDSLPANSLLMPPPTVACHTGTSCSGRAAPPTISLASNTAIDSGTAVTVASAAVGKGMGTYDFTAGTIGSGNLQLTVPSAISLGMMCDDGA